MPGLATLDAEGGPATAAGHALPGSPARDGNRDRGVREGRTESASERERARARARANDANERMSEREKERKRERKEKKEKIKSKQINKEQDLVAYLPCSGS